VEVVAVGVDDQAIPHRIADERFLRSQAAGLEFVVEGEGIFALEAEGGTNAAFLLGSAMGIVFLEHESRAA
jgi:hypothetical protein